MSDESKKAIQLNRELSAELQTQSKGIRKMCEHFDVRDAELKTVKLQKSTSGFPLWVAGVNTGFQAGQPAQIIGYQYLSTVRLPNVGNRGDFIFGDLGVLRRILRGLPPAPKSAEDRRSRYVYHDRRNTQGLIMSPTATTTSKK